MKKIVLFGDWLLYHCWRWFLSVSWRARGLKWEDYRLGVQRMDLEWKVMRDKVKYNWSEN